jgi:predicted  nucleic acid-binding Zn-ribbon protein
MQKIDIQNFNKYYLKNDGNATLARVGHVNAVVEEINTEFENIEDQFTTIESDITSLENRLDEIADNVFADNAAAITGGLAVGTLYSTAAGAVRIVV